MAEDAFLKVEGQEQVVDDEAFIRLEAEFKETLEQLVGGEGHSVYTLKEQYIKMHKALTASHNNERRLMRTCRELNKEIVDNSSKVKDALKLSQEDQNVISQLKTEIDKAWKSSDMAEDKNCRARETIQSLKAEIVALSKMAEKANQAAAGGGGQDAQLAAMAEEREELKEMMSIKDMEADKMKALAKEAAEQITELEVGKEKDEEKRAELNQELQLGKNEFLRESRKRERADADLRAAKETLANKEEELNNAYDNLDKEKAVVLERDNEIRTMKVSQELLRKEDKKLKESLLNMQTDLELMKQENADTRTENENFQFRLKTAGEEIALLKSEIAKQKKVGDVMLKKLRSAEETIDANEREKEVTKTKVGSLLTDLEKAKKTAEKQNREMEDIRREKDKIIKNLQKGEATIEKLQGILKMNAQIKKEQDKQIDRYKEEIKKLRLNIHQMEKDRDKLITQSAEKDTKMMAEMETTKKQELQLFDFKKQVTENSTKMRQQENLYESARQEKNNYAKNLMETKDQLAQFKRKCELTEHEADQLKEEVTRERNRTEDVRRELAVIEERKNRCQSENNKLKVEMETLMEKCKAAEDSEKFAQKTIAEKEAERLRQKKEFDKLTSERDLIGTQLVRRNDEMACLYEKSKLQQTRMGCGEVHYNARVNDIGVLSREMQELKRENKLLSEQCADRESLHREVCRLGTELNAEQLKVKQLEMAVETPQNVHRFRLLNATDPTKAELNEKVVTLQHRLLNKTDEVKKRELTIQDLEMQVGELQRTVDRLPGPQQAEKLAEAHRTIRKKRDRIDSLEGQRSMLEQQAKQHKYEKGAVEAELKDWKKKFYTSKKDYENLKELERQWRRSSSGDSSSSDWIEVKLNASTNIAGNELKQNASRSVVVGGHSLSNINLSKNSSKESEAKEVEKLKLPDIAPNVAPCQTRAAKHRK